MFSEVASRRLSASTMLLALALTSLFQVGCSSPIRRLGILDELAISFRDRVWAQRAYNLRFANSDRQYADHFKNGFCAGYTDVCNGGDGFVPALPPDSYRGFEYQCAEGAKCVDSWFEGYPEGVAAAREEQAGEFHEMQISRMIDQAVTQAKAPNALPADVPVKKPSSNLIPPTKLAQKIALPRIRKPFQQMASVVEQTSLAPAGKAAIPVANNRWIPRKELPESAAPMKAKKDVSLAEPLAKKRQPAIDASAGSSQSLASRSAISSGAPEKTAEPFVPPIVRVKPVSSPKAGLPPIVSGKKIDPSTSVMSHEIPLPVSVSQDTVSRSAARSVNRR